MEAWELVGALEDYAVPVADQAQVRAYTEDGQFFDVVEVTVDDGGRVVLLKLEIAE